MSDREKCIVREGRFVEPCGPLEKATEYGNPPTGKQRGIYAWAYKNTETHAPSRTFFGAKSTSHPTGMAFNFCPWCGERIDAPLLDGTKEAQSK